MESTTMHELALELTITDAELIAELEQYADGSEREQFALKALKIGIMALRQARGQIDAEAVRKEGERLMNDLKHRLDGHERVLNERLGATLKEYFDPQSGRFQERVERLVKQDGELEQTLKRQIAGEDSELTRTLLEHFGAESPLMKMLHPDQSRGLLSLLKQEVEGQLKFQRDQILNQFSLNDQDSALSRMLRELTQSHGKLTEDFSGKIDILVKEFSQDEEASALNRLIKKVTSAQETITKEFSLDNENSSLVRLQKTLSELLVQQQTSNQKFQEEVKEALAAMKARKEESLRSTRHGVGFEDTLFEILHREAQRHGDIAVQTGNTTGLIKGRKVGDAVVELSQESAAPGAKIVFEAKEDKSYDLAAARAEIELCRQNRGAQVGVFVFSIQSAPDNMEPVWRYGDDLFVIWDAEDERSDLFLKIAYSVARALCVKAELLTADQKADFDAIDKAINEIERQIENFAEIDNAAENIKKQGDKILDRVRIMRNKLTKEAETLRTNTEALRQSVD